MHDDTDSNTPYKIATLVFPINHQEKRIVLGLKKTGLGAGFFNGFGGKVEQGETIRAAAMRELAEETGVNRGNLEVNLLQHCGKLRFKWPEKPQNNMLVHVYWYEMLRNFTPRPTEEMTPAVFALADVPYGNMWPDDSVWLWTLLNRRVYQQVIGNFEYNNMGHLTNIEMNVGPDLLEKGADNVIPLKLTVG